MNLALRIAAGLALGTAVGLVSSLSNAAAASYGYLGEQLAAAGGAWQTLAKVASIVLGTGCVWAGIAVAAGWLAGTRVAGAAAGVLALAAGTVAYHWADSILRLETFGFYWYELRFWWIAGAVLAAVLGAVGSRIEQPGLTGFLAGLTVPLGAVIETGLLPGLPGGLDIASALDWARLLVWAAAVAAACLLCGRLVAGWRRPRAAGRARRT